MGTLENKMNAKNKSSAKKESGKDPFQSTINLANALDQIKNGETGGQRIMGIANILRLGSGD